MNLEFDLSSVLSSRSLKSPHAHQPYISSSLIHKQAKEAPPIYVTGAREYSGVLADDTAPCSERRVWKELITKAEICSILKRWKQRTLPIADDDVVEEKEIAISQIPPFRMILHRMKRMKLSYSRHGGMKAASKCRYFVLLWVPSNNEDGMNEREFNDLVGALRRSRYFASKLNKESLYISGPTYGHTEDIGDAAAADSDEKFDLEPLTRMTRSCLELPPEVHVDIEVVVHEMDYEVFLF